MLESVSWFSELLYAADSHQLSADFLDSFFPRSLATEARCGWWYPAATVGRARTG